MVQVALHTIGTDSLRLHHRTVDMRPLFDSSEFIQGNIG